MDAARGARDGSGHAAVGEDIFEQGFEWLEQWCYFGVPTQKDAKPMYLQQFARLQSLADAATGDFEKYELLEKASNLATARGLTREKDVAAATTVIAADSYCASTSWDSICVGEVTSVAKVSCP